MQIVIFGAGAVGSVIGGRLAQHAHVHGHDITLVARGAHCAAINQHGLTINDVSGSTVVGVAAVERIDLVTLDDGDVVLLAMKSQDTPAALEQLARHAPSGIEIVCAQNGVDNERVALRRFRSVHGVCVMLPATYLQPGVVDAHGTPHNAILDIGRFPSGTDDVTESIAGAFRAAQLASEARPDIMRWKYGKLMMNLANPVDALIADPEHAHAVTDAIRAEAEACLDAAGIDRISAEVDQARRAGIMQHSGQLRDSTGLSGSSTWQSLERGAPTTEVDWLNGEVVMLGRLHCVPTPVNERLCRATRWVASSGVAPRSLTVDEVLTRPW